MARPREFDEREVLDKALEVFWARGFEATSIQDLVDATGLGRASLYGAFGDKQQLFEKVLGHYVARASADIRQLDGDPSVRAALERLLRGWVAATCPNSGPRGCFLQQAATASDDAAPFPREALTASLKQAEKALEALLRRAQDLGEMPKDRDPVAAARLLVVLQQGIAASARIGWSPEKLRSAVDEAVAQALGSQL